MILLAKTPDFIPPPPPGQGCPPAGSRLQSRMPSGKVHLTVELTLLPGWVAAGALIGLPRLTLTAFALSYTCASLLLSPDLDLARSSPASRWGPLRLLWAPYAWLFRHRGLSHSLFWGPATRLLYLSGLVLLVLLPLHVWLEAPLPQAFPTQILTPVLAGVYLSHLMHVGLDGVWSYIGRRLPGR